MTVPPAPSGSNSWVWCQSLYGPRSWASTKRTPGFHSSIPVSQETGTPCRRRRYSISAPTRMSIGRGVTIRKPSQAGVIASRLPASAKNGKTASGGPGSRCSRRRTWWPNIADGIRALPRPRSPPSAVTRGAVRPSLLLDARELGGREGAAEAREPVAAARRLCEPAARGDQHPRRLGAEEPPVMTAREEPEVHVGPSGVQLGREGPQQPRIGVVGPALEDPRPQPEPPDLRREAADVLCRAVVAQGRRARPGEHAGRRLAEVAAPALDHAEGREVVQPDIERGVAAERVAGDAAVLAVRDRREAVVDVVDDVHDVRHPPARGRVGPLGVGAERPRLACGHDED